MDPWYLIGYVIVGDAGRYHRSLTKKLSSRFHVPPYHEHAPPHITYVAPFLLPNIDALKPLIRETVAQHRPHEITMSGLGAFNDRVIYLDIQAPEESKELWKGLGDAVEPYVRPRDREKFIWHPHVTLAHKRFLGTHFRNMMEYLHTLPSEHHTMTVSKLHLLVHSPETRNWTVHDEFPLG